MIRDRGYLLLIMSDIKIERWVTNTRFKVAKVVLDFAQSRSNTAARVGKKRSLRYGDHSWQRRWTFWQERFWKGVGHGGS